MRFLFIILLLNCLVLITSADDAATKDLEDPEDVERKLRRKKKKHQQQNNGGCGSGGYGRTFGEKFLGLHDYTYVSAPVMNYLFGCGVAAVPVAPVAPIAPAYPAIPAYPIHIGVSQSQNGHGGGHGGFGGGGHGFGGGGHGLGGGGGGHGFGGGYNGYGNGAGNYYQQPYQNDSPQHAPQYQQPQYQQPQYPSRPYNRPIQNVVSAAASGLGTAFADYLTSNRPKKTYNQINRQVNKFLNLF